MVRYFKDKLNDKRSEPVNIPDTPAQYMYVDDYCYIAVTDPSQKWLRLGLEEVTEAFLEDKVDRVLKVPFPIKSRIAESEEVKLK